MKTIYDTQDDIEVDGLDIVFQDECMNLSVATEQPIIAIAIQCSTIHIEVLCMVIK